MTDDDQPQVALLRLVQQKGPDLGLGDEVQHGADLVAQQIAHPGPQGTGNAEPLKLTDRQLRGIPLPPGGLDVKGLQQSLLHGPTFF